MKKKINEKGSFSFFFVFIVSAIILIFFFAFMTPLMMQWNTTVYESSEGIFEDAKVQANDINNTTVRTAMLNSITASEDSLTTQTDILGTFFQYSWVIILFVTALTIFLFARMQVESGGVA